MILELSSNGSPTALRVIYYRIESRIESRNEIESLGYIG
jgi:hypothetical protein